MKIQVLRVGQHFRCWPNPNLVSAEGNSAEINGDGYQLKLYFIKH